MRLAKTLEGLPVGQRESLEMHYLQGLTLTEIAERMQRSKPSVAGLLQRGLAALRANFARSMETKS